RQCAEPGRVATITAPGPRSTREFGRGPVIGRHKVSRVVIAMSTAVVLSLAGCGFSGIYDIPLPGGAELGDDPYRVHVQFRDVLDLVPQSGVPANNVRAGRVESIALADDGWTAD